MGNSFSYRIGIDVGIASTGWAVIQVDSKDEPIHIIDMGLEDSLKLRCLKQENHWLKREEKLVARGEDLADGNIE